MIDRLHNRIDTYGMDNEDLVLSLGDRSIGDPILLVADDSDDNFGLTISRKGNRNNYDRTTTAKP